MTRRRDVEDGVALLKLEAEGQLDTLPCPRCRTKAVFVSYTNPHPGEYRTWFRCAACEFEMRSQNSGRPAHFTETRVDLELQERDRR